MKEGNPSAGWASSTERHFYSMTRAFGRFGIRIFEPAVMEAPHWHGHIELNYLCNATMIYRIDGEDIRIPEGRLVAFWAGVPHQLIGVETTGAAKARLCNVYLPVDACLFMPHIARLQVSFLSGGMAILAGDLCDIRMLERWYGDYRSGDLERTETVKMEINALFRRHQFGSMEFLRPPATELGEGRDISAAHIRHVVAMVRDIMENLSQPLRNVDVTRVTGLHENYALSLFSRTMRMPMKQFIIRMRLLRARAMLTESSIPITTIAEACGFTSISQFYHQFKMAYGQPPNSVRENYMRNALR